MKWQIILKVSCRSLLKNRMRSLLTSLGIIIGVGAVTVMVAIGEGAQKDIEKNISSLGSNLIIVFPSFRQVGGVNQGAGSFNRLTMDDVAALEQNVRFIRYISPTVRQQAQVIGGVSNWSTTVWGVSPSYLSIRDWKLESGEVFSEKDMLTKGKVALIGKTVVTNLFPDVNPIGQRIRVNNIPFRVIGVLAEKGQDARGEDQDDVVLAPATTILARLKGGQYIDMINLSAKSTAVMSAAQSEITEIMRDAHKINPGKDNDFNIMNQAEILKTVSETSKTLSLLLGSIAGVSLIVGGIGIMNIMLVSVTERTREIGIRLAIGARENDVMIQFLTEAVVLSMIGGLIGIGVSFLVSYILNTYAHITNVINPTVALAAFLFSGGIGVCFGFFPARKAASLNPIDALRYE